jgi:hypothetical protein
MMVTETHAFACDTVMDDTGTDYLYTRYLIAVRAIVNGEVLVVQKRAPGPFMSYRFSPATPDPIPGGPVNRLPSPTSAPTVVPVTVPAGTGLANAGLPGLVALEIAPVATNLTHQAIRHRLAIPRGQLYVFAGPGMESGVPPVNGFTPPSGPLFLASPAAGFPVDCKNGPIPRSLSVVNAMGDANTLTVDWACETYVNENAENKTLPRAMLLSNRFRQQHVIDHDGYTTIRTQGTAIYRTDYVYLFNQTPDADRPILFMPTLAGFKRENIVVSAREDVTGADYAYDDVQVPVNFVAGPFAKAATVTALHRQAITARSNVAGATLTAYERIINLKAQRNFAKSGDGDGTPMMAKGPAGRAPKFYMPSGGLP